MKTKLNRIFLFMALLCGLADFSFAGEEKEAQQYQVNFELQYNAEDAVTVSKILKALEMLKNTVGTTKLEPCNWEVRVKSVPELISFTSAGTRENYILTVTDGSNSN